MAAYRVINDTRMQRRLNLARRVRLSRYRQRKPDRGYVFGADNAAARKLERATRVNAAFNELTIDAEALRSGRGAKRREMNVT